ncbi:S4 domain-containing protein YaaA [Streptococcus dentiloxodontae]
MDYKLFDDYITLQSLLKNLRIISSGGASKRFLAENIVLFNGEDEKRRGKKLRIGDIISIPEKNLTISILAPTKQEIAEYQEVQAEKERVAKIVKKMNHDIKKNQASSKTKNRKEKRKAKQNPIRFPGT